MTKLRKLQIFLNYLYNGNTFVVDDFRFCLGEDENLVWVTAEVENPTEGWSCDLPFNEVLEMIDGIKEEDIIGMAASNALSRN